MVDFKEKKMTDYFDKEIKFLDNQPNIALFMNFVCTREKRLDLIKDVIPKYAELFDNGPLKVKWYVNLNQNKWLDEIHNIFKSSIKEENLVFYNNLEKDWGMVTYAMVKDLKEPYILCLAEDFPCFTYEEKEKYFKWLDGQHFFSGQKDFGMNQQDWNNIVNDVIIHRQLDFVNFTKINKYGTKKFSGYKEESKYCYFYDGKGSPTGRISGTGIYKTKFKIKLLEEFLQNRDAHAHRIPWPMKNMPNFFEGYWDGPRSITTFDIKCGIPKKVIMWHWDLLKESSKKNKKELGIDV